MENQFAALGIDNELVNLLQTGIAITLVTPKDEDALFKIEKGIKTHLDRQKVIIHQVKENSARVDVKLHRSNQKPRGNQKTGSRKGFQGKHTKAGGKSYVHKTAGRSR